MSDTPSARPQRLVHIGLLLAADERDEIDLHGLYQVARDRLLAALTGEFPQFTWQVDLVRRRRFSPRGSLDPVEIAELAAQERAERRWDFALAVVPNELTFRDRPTTWGVPSSALEVALISTAAITSRERFGDELAAMALHLLGHLWGLEHDAEGVMQPPDSPAHLGSFVFPEPQRRAAADHLEEVADARIEEELTRRGVLRFYWRTLSANPRGIFTAVWGYSPWRLPFRLGRLTFGALTFLIVLLLTAETWEIGASFSTMALAVSTAGTIVATALFLFVGQNLGKASGPGRWREQLIRTRLVMFGSLLVGVVALWAMLFVTGLLAGLAMPEEVVVRWLGVAREAPVLLRYATLTATLGLFGGALGGSLESEGNFKPKFLFDEDA